MQSTNRAGRLEILLLLTIKNKCQSNERLYQYELLHRLDTVPGWSAERREAGHTRESGKGLTEAAISYVLKRLIDEHKVSAFPKKGNPHDRVPRQFKVTHKGEQYLKSYLDQVFAELRATGVEVKYDLPPTTAASAA